MATNTPYRIINNFTRYRPDMLVALQRNPMHFLASLKGLQHANIASEVGIVANEDSQSPFTNDFDNDTFTNDQSNITLRQGMSSCYEIR